MSFQFYGGKLYSSITRMENLCSHFQILASMESGITHPYGCKLNKHRDAPRNPAPFPFRYNPHMAGSVPAEQILDASFPELDAQTLLGGFGFVDSKAALYRLRRMANWDHTARRSLPSLLPHLLHMLGNSADPDGALVDLERLTEKAAPGFLGTLDKDPRALEILITVFSGSRFLTEILIRNPDAVRLFHERKSLSRLKTVEQYRHEAEVAAAGTTAGTGQREALRRYQRVELVRIGTNDLLNLFDLQTITRQLSNLADGLVAASLQLAVQQAGVSGEGFLVLAFGKLGGEELNYSSDIDLVFVVKSGVEEKQSLARALIENLAGMTPEGFLYRVDTRLRPWGREGALLTTLDGYLNYLKGNARLWEKQALLKARPVAGDFDLGQRFLGRVMDHLFDIPPEQVRANVHAMKQRMEGFLREKGRQWGEVKLGEGSIRDVEFVVQYLQLAYGGRYPDLRNRSTLQALPRLADRGLLSRKEERALTEGYVFLRTIEHYLQIMNYQQTYTLPSDASAIQSLARRLGFQGARAGKHFLHRYDEHCRAIRAGYLHYVGNQEAESVPEVSPQVRRHLSRMDVSYAQTFQVSEIRHHASLIQELDDEVPAVLDPTLLEDGTWRVTIVAYDYPGELSIICGLLFVYGFNILDGNAFTYEPLEGGRALSSAPATAGIGSSRRPARRRRNKASDSEKEEVDRRQKIVDVFTVKPVFSEKSGGEIWEKYTQDLFGLLRLMRNGQRREARGQLARRVGAAFELVEGKSTPLYPVEIEIDNEASDEYTVLRIDAQDTVGFLYEFTTALAFTQVYVARMQVRTLGDRAQDVLYVTDYEGRKITSAERQRELRVAVVLIKHVTHLLPRSPNPEAALLHFREFLQGLFQRPNWPDEIASIERPDVLDALVRVMGVSDFLWDDFLRMQYGNLFPVLSNPEALASPKDRSRLDAELREAIQRCFVGGLSYPDWRAALNAFKDRELFRIDMRHLLGLTVEFWDFAREVTDLAESVVQAAFENCYAELQNEHGHPLREDGRHGELAVLALGKCGGREMGFASDIDLMFIYSGNGRTGGPVVIDNNDFYERLVESVLRTVGSRQEGIFQIDLQLRPYGKAGSLAVSLEAFRRYYAPDGPAWPYERQALMKLRPIAGKGKSLGRQVCELRDSYVYEAGSFDVTAMRGMRERQTRHLVKGGTFNAKHSPGGLVDVEYLVQGLQINHGTFSPALRTTNLREAMAALAGAGMLSEEDYVRLRKAHTFLCWLIDSMRVVRGNSRDVTVPPYDSNEFAFLARRLLYEKDIGRLRKDLEHYAADVLEINHRLLKSSGDDREVKSPVKQ